VRIEIWSNLELSDVLRRHVERRLRSALGRFRHHVHAIRVRLSDVNGPRRGIDKRCRLVLSGPRGWTAVAQGLKSSFYDAVDVAVRRAACSVRRVSGRRANVR
jgi:putative sigma-54 modulation protein